MTQTGEQVKAGETTRLERTACYQCGPGAIGKGYRISVPEIEMLFPYQLEALIEPLFWRTR